MDTLGIINGCIDLLVGELSYPEMAYNNTYGIQAINETLYKQAVDNFNRPKTGCKDQILNCRSLADRLDPNAYGNNDEVNAACADATTYCENLVEGQYVNSSGRNYYDIAAIDPDPFPPEYFLGFLAQHWVQGALGVPINFTESTNGVYEGFQSTGDYARRDIRGGQLADIAYLLDKGIKVALMYGDRDYACNCEKSPLQRWNTGVRTNRKLGIGGEAYSLAVNYSQTAAFHAAGYQDIQVNSSYVGGQVRQHGNFSFSRVYQAGHEIPSYQPETAYQIFQRAIFGLDIATGKINTESTPGYSSTGSPTTFQVKNDVPPSPAPTCYILAAFATCTDDAFNSVLNGSALIHDYIVIDRNSSALFPGLSTSPGSNNASYHTGLTPSGTISAPGSEFTGGAYGLRVGFTVWCVVVGVGLMLGGQFLG